MPPIVSWLKRYDAQQLTSDGVAAFIVTVLLIPQSLAYAMLAGLPPEQGLYASVLPLVAYAIFGSSRTLSVGPVAVVSLLTASSVSSVVSLGVTDYLTAATTLAWMSGGLLLAMGLLKLGFMANFLSHSVISGFITASGILIAFSQLKHLFGIPLHGDNLIEIGHNLAQSSQPWNYWSLAVGVFVLAFLLANRRFGNRAFCAFGLNKQLASLLAKSAPVFAVVATIAMSYFGNLERHHVALVGHIPAGLPSITIKWIDIEVIKALFIPALMISIIGYVESVSVGKTLAAKRRQAIDPNQELVGLGTANFASALSSGFPVTGGFSRSVVNFDAGAQTQMASIFTAIGIALASLFLTQVLYFLPKATLAATIIVAVLSLIDFSIFKKTWRFSKSDFWAVSVTVAITLGMGVEAGVISGVSTSLLLYIYRSAQPHIAELGQVPGTEHFRNVQRYEVEIDPQILMLRLDESLFFGNAQALQDHVDRMVFKRDEISHVILVCSAINSIDYSALEVLESLNQRLSDQGIALHFAEIKGPVMDALQKTHLIDDLSGQVFLTPYDGFRHLSRNT